MMANIQSHHMAQCLACCVQTDFTPCSYVRYCDTSIRHVTKLATSMTEC